MIRSEEKREASCGGWSRDLRVEFEGWVSGGVGGWRVKIHPGLRSVQFNGDDSGHMHEVLIRGQHLHPTADRNRGDEAISIPGEHSRAQAVVAHFSSFDVVAGSNWFVRERFQRCPQSFELLRVANA